ncbi:BTB domain-containing protein [Mycena indigotica]|uniref:BTB domain-containing protein n=1 Tax=Mycena indigotica TaxID=2126181 RepID=A0A8H6S585_9AGAR|nr:BTB domain-containing protein [Mycena indigotica]KAF7292657.1 BTB domain-containing protein [Mycena indigotica]
MNPDSKPCSQSTHFWLRDHGMLVFEVQHVLFRVHAYFLHRDSPVLRDMAPVEISATGPEPVFHLDGVKSKDFEHLLWLYYNPLITNYTAPKTTWQAILRLADRFEMDNIKKIALRNLLVAPDVDPFETIMLCEREDMARAQAEEAYIAILTRNAPLSAEEIKVWGLTAEVIAIITQAREEVIKLRNRAEEGVRDLVKAALKNNSKMPE